MVQEDMTITTISIIIIHNIVAIFVVIIIIIPINIVRWTDSPDQAGLEGDTEQCRSL